ncbi:DUF1285 domain-containing protein [Motiliproteus sp. SC1-56]|uniref:DUF1285 domain-containing protein n=1 Tax=Motiliproteus sp. SC1-56 TaxID=2799565 RepID=UPI001A8D0B60|nr:DUF1285 domain-containing protein [Motiliproteus sp. SC1-56]
MKRDALDDIEQLAGNTVKSGRPPVHEWNPPLSGDISIRIAADGRWYHQGSPIQREQLVKLFASILRREGNEYFLVTPVEKWRLEVEDVPFQVVAMEVQGSGTEQCLQFFTDMGDEVVAGDAHPLRVETLGDGEPRPYLMIRDGLEGRLVRPVFYRLAELARESSREGRPVWVVQSAGREFVVGQVGDSDESG